MTTEQRDEIEERIRIRSLECIGATGEFAVAVEASLVAVEEYMRLTDEFAVAVEASRVALEEYMRVMVHAWARQMIRERLRWQSKRKIHGRRWKCLSWSREAPQ